MKSSFFFFNFLAAVGNDSHFGDLQMSKKRYLLQKKMPYNISHLCGAIVSSFNGEQLKKCDSLYISKGIREYSRGVFITHDLGDLSVWNLAYKVEILGIENVSTLSNFCF